MSSYLSNDINYCEVLELITFSKQPKKIVEFGILKGHSLDAFIKGSCSNTIIEAYDIFAEFNGNGADYETITKKYNNYQNVKIAYGDFYKNNFFEDNSIDILHVDIANNGDVYRTTMKNYLSKMKRDGIIILEGGSIDRDNVEWMKKYNKKSIQSFLKSCPIENYKVIGKFPSMTIFKDLDLHDIKNENFNFE